MMEMQENLTISSQHNPDALDSRSAPRSTLDPEIQLLIPKSDVEAPEVSIVVPALNEQLTISDFVSWCKLGLAQAGAVGEVLIIDSSTDRTSEIALEQGAR